MKNLKMKKAMSVFLAVLMLLSCWVFVPGEHNNAYAASGSATPSAYVTVYDGTERDFSDKIILCSDTQSDNTTLGLMRFNISSFPDNVTTATLSLNVGNHNGTLANSTAGIFSVDPSLCPDGQGAHKSTEIYAAVFQGSYTGTSAAANAYSYFGVTAADSLGTVTQSPTGSQTFDVTSAVNEAKSNAQTELCLLFVMPQAYYNGDSNRWSDLHIYGSGTSLSYTKADPVSTYPVNYQLNGGLSAAFANTAAETVSSVYSIDTSDSKTYYLNLVNHSTQDATVVAMNNTGYLSGYSDGIVIPAGETKSFQINKSSLGSTDNQIINFSYRYTLDNVYQSGGASLAEFYQAAYIGTWHRSDDLTAIGLPSGETANAGFTLSGVDNIDVMNRFMVDSGILESSYLSGNRTTPISFIYNYWLDNSGGMTDWSETGLRMYAMQWSSYRLHLQPDAQGTLAIEGAIGNSDASLSMADLVLSYSSASDSFTYPATARPWAYVGSPCNPQWDGQTANLYGTLYDAGVAGIFRFCGNIFQGSTTTADPAKIVFTNMTWVSPALWVGGSRTEGSFSGTINCYIYDKTALKNYVASVLANAPMSTRFNSTAWNSYETALRNAMQVIANYKTTQYDVNQALTNLQSAYNTLNQNSALANQVANVTYYKHSGDYSSAVTESTAAKYMLIPVGSHTVVHYDSYKTGTNKSSAIVTNYTVNDTAVQTIDYHYWTIDFSAVQTALQAADEILAKDPWCYTAEYRAALQTARDNLAAVDQTEYTAAPELQSEVDGLVNAVNELVAAEATESNHAHVKGDLQTDSAPTCEDTGIGHYDCLYCGTRMESDVVIPVAEHTLTATAENVPTCFGEGNTAYWTCSVCLKVFTDAGGTAEIADNNGDGLKNADDAVIDALEHDFSESDSRLHNLGNGTHNWSCANSCGSYGTAEGINEFVSCTYSYTDKSDAVHTAVCSCGYTTDQEHAWDDGYEDPKAGCETTGLMNYTCTQCNGTKTEATSAKGHTSATLDAVEATCTQTGLTEGSYCSVCDAVIVAQEIVPMKEHSYSSVVTAPTCMAEGYTTHTCTVCGNSYTDSTVAASGHEWNDGEVTTAPGCAAEGQMTYTCTVCGTTRKESIPATGNHNYATEVEGSRTPATCVVTGSVTMACTCGATEVQTLSIDSTNHANVVTDAAVEATCTQTGLTEGSHCEACDTVIAEQTEVSMVAHSYSSVVTAPTCTAVGYTTHTCTVCGNSYTDTPTEKIEHSWNDGEVTTAPGCAAEGEMTYTCTICGATKTESIPATGNHNYVTEVEGTRTPATCVATGSVTMACTCGATEVQTLSIDSTNHANVVTDAAVEATCTQTGLTEGSHCEACDTVIAEQTEVSMVAHSYSSVVTAPTCTAVGYTTHTCTVCGNSYTDTPTEKIEHSWNDGEVTTAPGCASEGEMTYTCTVCGTTKTESIPATGNHNYATEVEGSRIPATCVATGSVTMACTCGATEVQTLSIDSTNHANIVTDAAVEATCTQTGLTEGSHCEACDTVIAEQTEVSMVAHSYSSVVTAPTCTAEGYTTHTCTVCGNSYTDSTVAAAGHEWNDGEVTTAPGCAAEGQMTYTCTVCGTTRTESIPATGHQNTETINEKTASCSEEGYTGDTYCNDCKTVITAGEAIAKLPHTEATREENRVEPSEDADGSYDLVTYCSVCKAVIRTETVIIPGTHQHNYTVIHERVESTCISEGYIVRKCECGDTKKEILPVSDNHIWEYDMDSQWQNLEAALVKAPTCRQEGVAYNYCVLCGGYTDRAIEKTAHIYQSSTVAPTCTNGGYTVHKCTMCTESYTDAHMSALGHSYSTAVTAPTCDKAGYTTYTCSICKVSYIADNVPASGHGDNNGDGNCDSCKSDMTELCTCLCHSKNFILKIIYKIIRFFWKLFGISQICGCGAVHY